MGNEYKIDMSSTLTSIHIFIVKPPHSTINNLIEKKFDFEAITKIPQKEIVNVLEKCSYKHMRQILFDKRIELKIILLNRERK